MKTLEISPDKQTQQQAQTPFRIPACLQPQNREQRRAMEYGPRPSLYTLSEILARGKFSKSHLYNLMARGQFPQPVLRMGPRFTRWGSDVDQWFSDPSAYVAAHSKTAA